MKEPRSNRSRTHGTRATTVPTRRTTPVAIAPRRTRVCRSVQVAPWILGNDRVHAAIAKNPMPAKVTMERLTLRQPIASRLGLEQRKENHIANRCGVRQSHHETIDPHPKTCRRRHAVLERPNVVFVVVHGVVVAASLALGLRAEAGSLIVRIVELAESIAELSAMNEELEAIGQVGARIIAAREG